MHFLEGDRPPLTYQFSNEWFVSAAKAVWDRLIPLLQPRKILEVGSYEGQSACYLIDLVAQKTSLELHCIDTWQGGVEHQGVNMSEVEARFRRNLSIAVKRAREPVEVMVHKAPSDRALARLLEAHAGTFDFIYIDGSHQAPDVLADAVLAFRLLKPKGVMVFDDYLWAENLPGGKDPLRMPKPAIDAFVNIYTRKVTVLPEPLRQLFVRKERD